MSRTVTGRQMLDRLRRFSWRSSELATIDAGTTRQWVRGEHGLGQLRWAWYVTKAALTRCGLNR
jgi:hypothetical protein